MLNSLICYIPYFSDSAKEEQSFQDLSQLPSATPNSILGVDLIFLYTPTFPPLLSQGFCSSLFFLPLPCLQWPALSTHGGVASESSPLKCSPLPSAAPGCENTGSDLLLPTSYGLAQSHHVLIIAAAATATWAIPWTGSMCTFPLNLRATLWDSHYYYSSHKSGNKNLREV